MKRYRFLFSVMMIAMAIVFNFCKTKDNPEPAERKKCAWVGGSIDNTGYGMILYSADGGENWERQGEGNPALQGVDILDIWAVDDQTVWAVCSRNVILKTLDGGKTWVQVQAPENDPNTWLSSICIVNQTNIWISGSLGTVYSSTDNGNTWTKFDPNIFHNQFMQGIWAITPQKVYVAGNGQERGYIFSTTDGGATWDSISPSANYNKNNWIGVTSYNNVIVIYGGKSHYTASTDGGITWKNDSVQAGGGAGAADLNDLFMLNPETWWGAFDLGQIFLTNDGGSSWISQETNQNGQWMFGIDAWDSQFALAVSRNSYPPLSGLILKTVNGGTTWEVKQSYSSRLSKVSFIKQ
jgi:photosystem II stability/assembly factor-like uncharacterized protein